MGKAPWTPQSIECSVPLASANLQAMDNLTVHSGPVFLLLWKPVTAALWEEVAESTNVVKTTLETAKKKMI